MPTHRPPVRTALAVTAGALLLGSALPARAFDMTGLWVGTIACKGFNGVKTKSTRKDVNLFVTHGVDHSVVLRVFAGTGNDYETYLGVSIDDVTRPERGEIALASCGADDDLLTVGADDAVGRFNIATKVGKVAATFKGSMQVSRGSVLEFQSCKWTFKRRDTTDPGLIGCDQAI